MELFKKITKRLWLEPTRPHPPRLNKLTHAEEASNKEILSSLKWAAAWCGYQKLSVRPLLPVLKAGLSDPKQFNKLQNGDVVHMALRLLRLEAAKNRAERSANALPWVVFCTGPQEQPCASARELVGKCVATKDGFQIPLPACDQLVCKCHFRAITRREMEQKNM